MNFVKNKKANPQAIYLYGSELGFCTGLILFYLNFIYCWSLPKDFYGDGVRAYGVRQSRSAPVYVACTLARGQAPRTAC